MRAIGVVDHAELPVGPRRGPVVALASGLDVSRLEWIEESLMGDDGFNYLNPEDRRRPNESELFGRVSVALVEKTKLSALEARGTLAIALKVAGFLSRDVGLDELMQTVQTVLPGELRVRGVTESENVCAEIAAQLRAG